jgi:hypothetical protein
MRALYVSLGLVVALSGCNFKSHPPQSFEATPSPPAPDYSKLEDWLAFPGRNGLPSTDVAASMRRSIGRPH